MQLNNFEREFKEQAGKQPVYLDIEQTWASLNKRLDDEYPQRKKGFGFGRWGLGILVCMFLGFCVTGLMKSNEATNRLIEFGLPAVVFIEEPYENAVTSATAGDEIVLAQLSLIPNGKTVNSRRKLSANRFHSDLSENSAERTILTIKKTEVNRSKPVLNTYKVAAETQSSTELLIINSAQNLSSSRSSKFLAALPTRSGELVFNYHVEASAIVEPIQIPSTQNLGALKSIKLAGGWSKPTGSYSSNNAEYGNYIKYKNDALQYLESINFSFSGTYSLIKNLHLGLGVQYQKINQALEISRLSLAHRTLEDVVVEIRINPYTLDSSFVRANIEQKGESFYSVRHYNSMTRWSVPLKFEYLNHQDRWGFGLAIGTSFSFSHVSRGRFIQTDGTVSNVQVRHPANVHFLSLEPIITFALGHPFVLDFRPHFQQAINNGAVVHSVFHRPKLWGFDLGVRYEWGGRD